MKKIKLKERAALHVFFLSILILILFSGIIRLATLDSLPEVFIAATLLQVFVFGIPLYFYTRYKGGREYLSSLSFRAIRARHIPLLISLLMVTVFGALFINSVMYVLGLRGADFISTASYTLRGLSTNTSFIYVFIAFAIIPAILEETVFRGVIYRYFLKSSSISAAIISALFFAISRFDLAGFPAQLLMGLVLSFSVRLTGSILAPMLIHFFSNLLSVYLLPSFWNVMIQPMGMLFAIFIIFALLTVFIILALHLSEKYFLRLAKTVPENQSYRKETLKESLALVIAEFKYPVFSLSFIIFIISVTIMSI